MSESSSSSSSGIGFTGLLTVLFVGLKLTHFIDWRWRWVLSPIWISIVLWVVFIGGFFGVSLLVIAVDDWNTHRQLRVAGRGRSSRIGNGQTRSTRD